VTSHITTHGIHKIKSDTQTKNSKCHKIQRNDYAFNKCHCHHRKINIHRVTCKALLHRVKYINNKTVQIKRKNVFYKPSLTYADCVKSNLDTKVDPEKNGKISKPNKMEKVRVNNPTLTTSKMIKQSYSADKPYYGSKHKTKYKKVNKTTEQQLRHPY
jgi:hypothetical protein